MGIDSKQSMFATVTRGPNTLRPAILTTAGLMAVAMGACQRPPDPTLAGRLQPTYDQKTGRLNRLAYDSDGDGTTDTWGFMDGTRVLRVESDEDQDGTIDRWEFHRGASGEGDQASSPLQTVERIERSTRHDGHVTRWEFFERGTLTRVEEDINSDGKVDKWETYTSGALSTMALDTEARGTPDRRFIYQPDGTLDRIEVDPLGSGDFGPLKP